MNLVQSNSANRGMLNSYPTLANFELAAVAREPDLISSGGNSNTTTLDRNVTTYTGATYDNVFELVPTEKVVGTITEDSEYQSLDEGVATVDQSGRVTRVSNGTARVQLVTPRLTQQISVAMLRTSGGSTPQFTGYTTGTLAQLASAAIDTRIAGLTHSIAMPLYSSLNHAGSVYVRNANRWLTGVDLTCVPVWKTYWAGKFGGVAISPRHVLFANHAPPLDQSAIRFVTSANVAVERTITNQLYASADFRVGKLNSDLPASITPCKVMPADTDTYLPSLTQGYKIPAIIVDQNSNAIVADYYIHADPYGRFAYFAPPTDATRLSFYSPLISGDSGGFAGIIVNNELALESVMTGGYDFPYGYSVSSQITAINSAMTTLGGGYQLTPFNFSGFPDF